MRRHSGYPVAFSRPGSPLGHSLLLTALAIVCLGVAAAAAPSVATVDVDTDPVYESDLTQQVTVTFDEPMDTLVAPTIAFSAIPTSNKVGTEIRPLVVENAVTTTVASTAPRNAAAVTRNGPIPDPRSARKNPEELEINKIVTEAPRLAPAVTPMIDGDASWLRNTPCKSAPESASAAPTPMETRTL